MSVNWQDSDSEARKYAYAAAMESGEFDCSGTTWGIYCDLREALIWTLLLTGFPTRSEWAITEGNWSEMYCRLHILEKVNGCYRTYNNGDKASREVFFTPEEVKSMIGLSVNAGNKSAADFRTYISQRLEADATNSLDRCTNPSPRDVDDPYRWEKLLAPTLVKEMEK
jgi:hypothetical protein